MSATEATFAPYLDRKSKLAVAGLGTIFLTVLLAMALIVGVATGSMIAPLIPEGPTQYAFLMSVHHALPTWGTWLLLFFVSPMPIVTIASWAALVFLAIDTFNLAMAGFRFAFIDLASSTFILQILTFVILLVYWLITLFATVWVWRILRFKARRRRTYADVEVEMLKGRRRQTPLALRGHPARATKAAEKML